MRGRKKIAIWTPGGIGGGHFDQGFPMIMKIVQALSKEFEITIYSVVSTGSFQIEGLRLVSPSLKIMMPPFRWIFLLRKFFQQHRKDKFNMVYSLWGYPTGVVAVFLSRLVGIPSVLNILGGDAANVPSVPYGHLLKPIPRFLVLWACNRSTKLITLSNNQILILKAHGLKREAMVIHWGADQNIFGEIKKEDDDVLRILHVANLTEIKDQGTLIKAFSHIIKKRKAYLRIVGPDYLNGTLIKLVRTLNLTDFIEFTGPVRFTEISRHYNWANSFILTSLSEGQNNAVTEAALSGLLLVSTPVGPATDIGHEGVIIVPFDDPETLAERFLEVAGNKIKRQKMIQTSRAWAIKHDFQYTIQELKKIFYSIT